MTLANPFDKYMLKPCPKCSNRYAQNPPLEAYNIGKYGCPLCENRKYIAVLRSNPDAQTEPTK